MVLGSWESLQAGSDHCGTIVNEPQVPVWRREQGKLSGTGNSQATGKEVESMFGREE